MSGLPKGWAAARLEELTENPKQDIVDGPFGSNLKASEYVEAGIPIVRLQNIDRNRFLEKNIRCVTPLKAEALSRHSFRSGDVIITKLGDPVGKACIVPSSLPQGIIVADVVRARIDERKALKEFAIYAINSPEVVSQINSDVKGSTRPRVNLSHIRELEIPLPPLKEQRRIVAKLETLLGKVDACQQRLAKIPGILKRFRQAVLAAACSGRLTADWREKQGLGEGDELPEGWRLCSVGDVGKVCNGSTPSRKVLEYWNGSIPWVSSGEVRNNCITGTRESISREGYDNSSVRLLPAGTVLLAMIGEGKTRGQTAILKIEATINQNIAAVVLDQGLICSNYLWYWFRCQYEITRQSGSGSGPQALNCQRVRELSLNLPPLPEQHEIVRRVDDLFTLADQLEARYAKAKTHVDRLTPSILAKAFRGELVPQDPNDEPASVLLDRIRAQRAQAAPVKRRVVAQRAPRRARPEKPAPAPPLPLVAEAAAGYAGNVPQAILAYIQPGVEYSRAEITAAIGITDAEWTWAIRQLKEEDKVVQTGERRGARYRRGKKYAVRHHLDG